MPQEIIFPGMPFPSFALSCQWNLRSPQFLWLHCDILNHFKQTAGRGIRIPCLWKYKPEIEVCPEKSANAKQAAAVKASVFGPMLCHSVGTESFLPRLCFSAPHLRLRGDVVEEVVTVLSEPSVPYQPSSPTLTLLDPDGSPLLACSVQTSLCQGSSCSPHAGTEVCALKLSPPSEAASAGGYLRQKVLTGPP